jgi:hypothetical protein
MRVFTSFKILVFTLGMAILPFGQLSAQTSPLTLNTSGSFTVPNGVKQIQVQAWGGGGGGKLNAGNNPGGGGGGGAFAQGVLAVSTSQSFTVTVGAGGAASTDGGASSFVGNGFNFSAGGGFSGIAESAGAAGGTSVFTSGTFISTASFVGGMGGGGQQGGGGPATRVGGGGGGSAFTNGNGNFGVDGVSGGAGGTGTGAGGAGGFGTTAGGNGIVPGGGGGGKGTDGAAGSGGSGRVIITWQAVNAGFTSVSATPGSVLANGVSSSTITITVRDQNNAAINGLEVGDFVFNGQGNGFISNFVSAGAGVYTFTVSNSTVQTINVGVTILGVSITETTGNITFTQPIPVSGNSSVSAIPTVVAATGTAFSTLTLNVFDADNVAIADLTVGEFGFTGQGSASIFNFTNTGGGTYTFRVTNNTPETINITASARSATIGSSGNIEFIEATAIYSFKSGAWNDPETWTEDPSGTTAVNQAVPDDDNFIIILVGRTVTLTDDINTDNLNVFIEEGAILDLGTYSTSLLNTLEGGGRLRTSRVVSGTPDEAYFPSVTNNLFIGSNGGTVEYNQQSNVTLPTNISSYRNLTIRNTTASAVTYTQASNLDIYGNFRLNNTSTGSITMLLGNNTTSRSISIDGNVNLNSSTTWQVADFNANHIVEIGGDLINTGSVIMTRRAQPVGWPNADPGYGTAPSEGRADVTFSGATDNKIDAFGLTRFNRLIVDKGIDQTNILTVNSTNVNNFQLFGQNNQTIENEENPESPKALFIRNGTLKLRDNVLIPSLSEGGRDFVINKNAALWVDGAEVYSTLNGAGNAAFTVIGKFRMSGNSFVSARGSAGMVFQRDAEIIIEGGEIRLSHFRPSGLEGDHRSAFVMSGGLMIVDGSGETGNADGRFSMRFEDNSISMSGGEIRVSTPQGNLLGSGIDIRVLPINQNITGGTWRAIIPDGTDNFRINSRAPLYNLEIEKVGTGAGDARLDQDLVILNDLTISSGTFQAFDNYNVTVGGDFTIASGATYNPNNNTTKFDGAGGQLFSQSGTIASSGLYQLSVDKSDTLSLAGSATTITVRDNFLLLSGALKDGGKTIQIAGNIENSGTHQGAGKLLLEPTGARTISGNGNGQFGNVDLSGSATNIIYTVDGSFSVNGEMNFIASGLNQRILDLGPFQLRLEASASLTGFNEDRYIRSLGTASAAGVTKVFGSSTTFTWPIGVGAKYTPATITLSEAPALSGSINMRPVDGSHPAVESPARALNYYWKVTATGFDLGTATVSKTFDYLNGDLGATIAASEEDLAPALYQINANQWTVGASSSVDEIANVITFDGVFYNQTLTGDYSAGDVNEPAPFIELEVFYSRTSGNWFDISTWSTQGHSGMADVVTPPSAGSIVIIGENHVVTVDQNDALTSYISILENATLDLGSTTGHNFGVVQGPTYGTFRISSNIFPNGDLLEFLENGTTEYYYSGSDYTLPTTSPIIASLDRYYNLIINAGSGNLTMPNLAITVLNDLTINGTTSSNEARFGSGTDAGLTVDGDMVVDGGSFRYRFAGTNSRTIEIKGNLVISSGAEFGFYDDTTNLIHTLILRGSLENNGTLNLQNNVNRHIRLIFRGATNANFTGSGAVTYSRLEIDKGSTKTPILTYNNSGTRTAADNAYVFTNGTLEFARAGIFVVSNTATEFTLASTTGLSVNEENATVRIGYNDDNAADLVLRGRLEVKAGLVEIGNSANNVNNDIVYAAAGTPEIFVSGGTLDVNGQIRRSIANVAGSLNYRQSGTSLVRIRGRNATTTRGMLEITNDGSYFEFKGDAVIQIFRGGSITYADFYVRPTSFLVEGGTILFKPTGVGSNQNYLLDVTTDLFNITVENDGTSVGTLNQQINNLVILNDLTIKTESVYNSNSLNLFVGGRLTREASSSFNPGDNTLTFTGANSEISGDFTTDSFFNVSLQAGANLSMLSSSPIRIRNNLIIGAGAIFDDNNNPISLLGNITNNGTHLSSANNSTSGIEFIGNTTQTISGAGIFGNLNIKTSALVTLAGDIEIANRLSLTTSSLNLSDKRLTLGLNAEVTNYSATRYIRSNGVLSDGGVRKRFASGAASFVFPIGVFNKYTPAEFNITQNTAAGTLTIKPINVKHPSHRISGTNLLNYYWNVTTTGFENLEVSHSYSYLQGDVEGNESIYVGARYLFPNWEPLFGIPGAVDDVANLIELTDVNYIRGDYTAGEANEFDEVSTYYSRDVACDQPTGCNWNDYDAVEEVYTAWSTIGHNGAPAASFPSGEPIIIKTGHRVIANGNTRTSESMQLNGTAEIDLGDTFSHNFGVVTGTGTIRIKATGSNQFIYPGGNYDGFAAADSGSVVFYGTLPGVLPTQTSYNNVTMIDNSERVQANVDWTVNGNIVFQDGTVDNTEFNRNVSLAGDWENNASASMYDPGSGKLIFIGNGVQSIKGDFATSFGFIEMKGSGAKNLEQTVVAEKGLIFDSSRLYLNDENLTMRAGATVTGTPSASSMIVINGDGKLRREINAAGSMTFPIGDTTSTADYTPATITFSSATFNNGVVEMSVVNNADVSCGGGNFINRYWQVEFGGITSFAGTGAFRYVNSDIFGDESKIFTLSRDINDTFCNFGAEADELNNTLNLSLSSAGFIITGGDAGSILPPTVQVSDIEFVTITDTTIELIWDATLADGDGRIVLVRADNPVSGTPANNTFYTADSNYSGTPGSVGSGNFVVYDGDGNTFTLTGLDPNRRYYFSIYEYNSLGAAITYLTTAPPTANAKTKVLYEISFNGERGWRMIAFPFDDLEYGEVFDTSANTGLITQGFTGSTHTTDSPNLLWYDETQEGTDNQRWRQPSNITNTTVPGRGYMYYVFGKIASDTRYENLPFVEDIEISLLINEQELESFNFDVTHSVDADTGWNLIGNPFAGDLNWDGPNWTKTNMMDAIYVWDPSLNAGTGGYLVWADEAGDAALGGIIPQGQAFWVKANPSPTLIASKDDLTTGGSFFGKEILSYDSTHDTNQTNAQSAESTLKPGTIDSQGNSGKSTSDRVESVDRTARNSTMSRPAIELRVQKGHLGQSAHIVFKEEARRGIDRTDAYYLQPLNDTYVSIYTMADGQKVSINSLPRRFNSIIEIPVHISGFEHGVSVNGSYSLDLNSFSDIPELWSIELVDRNTGSRVFWKTSGDDILYTAMGDEIKLSRFMDDSDGERYVSITSDAVANSPRALSNMNYSFDFEYDSEVRIQTPQPGQQIMMRSVPGTSQSRFMIRIHPNGEFPELPEKISLWQNYPNPFNPTTTIKFGLPQEERVTIEVYDVLGRRVATLARDSYPAGVHQVVFNARNYASGVYFVRMVAGKQIETRKMTLIK